MARACLCRPPRFLNTPHWEVVTNHIEFRMRQVIDIEGVPMYGLEENAPYMITKAAMDDWGDQIGKAFLGKPHAYFKSHLSADPDKTAEHFQDVTTCKVCMSMHASVASQLVLDACHVQQCQQSGLTSQLWDA